MLLGCPGAPGRLGASGTEQKSSPSPHRSPGRDCASEGSTSAALNQEATQGLEPLLRAARGRGNFIFCPEFYFLSPSVCPLPARAPLLLHVAGTRCAEQLHCLQLQGCGRAAAGAGAGAGGSRGWWCLGQVWAVVLMAVWDVCECSVRSAGRNGISSFTALPHVWPLAPSSFWALHCPISCNSDTVLSISSSPLSQKHPAPWQRVWPRKPERRGLLRDLELDFHPLRSEKEAKASVLSPEFVCW